MSKDKSFAREQKVVGTEAENGFHDHLQLIKERAHRISKVKPSEKIVHNKQEEKTPQKREYMGSDEAKYARKRPQWPSPSPNYAGQLADCKDQLLEDAKEEANFTQAIRDCEDQRKVLLKEIWQVDCDREGNKTLLVECYQALWACEGISVDERLLPTFLEQDEKITLELSLPHYDQELVSKMATSNRKRTYSLPEISTIEELRICEETQRHFDKYASSRWRYLRTCIARLDEAAKFLQAEQDFLSAIVGDLTQICEPALNANCGFRNAKKTDSGPSGGFQN